jgi:pyrroloquinoline quinone biosynthesis protein B
MRKITWLGLLLTLCYPVLGRQQEPFIMVLGVAQDAGFPHIGCTQQCCASAVESQAKQLVTSLAIADPMTQKWWLLEATPDITEQIRLFRELTNAEFPVLPDGIFLTHAHIGHYSGLMYLGREALGAKAVPVFAMPKMASFLKSNGPWSQLITLKNVIIKSMMDDVEIKLSNQISVTPFLVPHRDEYSETVGFRISTSHKKYLFIPDIDKWEKWNRNIIDQVKSVDLAFLDATFYSGDELPGRDIKEIPHPLVTETLELFKGTPETSKVIFIHLNHSNKLLWNANALKQFFDDGFYRAVQGNRY